jgi:hypothetical protein
MGVSTTTTGGQPNATGKICPYGIPKVRANSYFARKTESYRATELIHYFFDNFFPVAFLNLIIIYRFHVI